MRERRHIIGALLALAAIGVAAPLAVASDGSADLLGSIKHSFSNAKDSFHGFILFRYIPGVKGLAHQVVAASIVFILLLLVALKVGRDIRRQGDDLVPSKKFGLRTFVELIAQTALGMMRDIIGPDYARYFPLVGTLAFFILFNNLMGLIPGFYTSTDNVNTTWACGLIVFFSYHYFGMRAQGVVKYWKHMMTGGVSGAIGWALSPLLFPIELISHMARPLSLGLRLFGNMTGDHWVMFLFVTLVAVPNPIPVPFFALGMIVAVVQTLVFCLLTCVYIGMAVAHEEH